jgi:hypothetical protein
MTCLLLRRSLRFGPGREGKEITFRRRDAQGLAFSAVIPARVLQPEIEQRGNQNWRTSAVRTGSGDPWPDSVGG